MKRFVVVVLAMSLGMCVVGLAGESEREELFSPQTGVRFLDEGHLGGQIGLRIRYQDIEQVDEGDAGWIYLIPNWESGEIIDGLTLGLGGIVVQELWDDDGFEDTLDPGSSDDATWAGR
ncbi:MAG: hypothetical protein KGZ25_11900, partial [Planctomycetes bacterium]|nr:hypothetical protein [Planctomycetota bacterium]